MLEKKAEIGKYANENGEAKATRHFVDLNLKESSMRDWRDAYLMEVRELQKLAKPGEEIFVAKLGEEIFVAKLPPQETWTTSIHWGEV